MNAKRRKCQLATMIAILLVGILTLRQANLKYGYARLATLNGTVTFRLLFEAKPKPSNARLNNAIVFGSGTRFS
jgi:hypothetical protein